MTISKTTTNLSTLKINYLTEEQYQDALENQQINENEIYMTPGEGSIDATATPTTNKISKFDTNAKMNSTDMTAAQVEDFVENLDVGGGGGNHGIPAGGSNGQILAKNSATDYDVTWINNSGGVPSGGTTGQVLAKASNSDYAVEWVNQGGGFNVTSATLNASDWDNNSQTVSVTGVTATDIIIASPAPASHDDYVMDNIRCAAQATGELTFTCDFTPSIDVDVNLIIAAVQ